MNAVLTVAGSDSGCGAGVQADLFTFAANGAFGVCAFTSLTAQNPKGVACVKDVGRDFLHSQLSSVSDYFPLKAAKTGMLFSAENIAECVDFFSKNPQIKFVCDPVMISTSGSKLLKDDAISLLINSLCPLAHLVTPNLDEAKFILNCGEIDCENIVDCANELSKKLKTNILLKGGHLKGNKLLDVLFLKSGENFVYENSRVENVNTHGSGCTLSAAISANIALGCDLKTAVESSQKYLLRTLKNSLKIAGENFINHFPKK